MSKMVIAYKPGYQCVKYKTIIPFEKCREMVGSYIEVHTVGDVSVICDEDGKRRGKKPCMNLDGCLYVGTVLVGSFADRGLEPVSDKQIAAFERHIERRY